MLQPKRTKYRKQMKGRTRGKASGGNTLSFGSFGLQTLETVRLTARQIEAARIAMTRYVKRGGRIWIRVFPDKPMSKKPAEVRMGKGKGTPEFWVAPCRAGRILYELDGVPHDLAKEALRLASRKLPCKTRFVTTVSEGTTA